MTSRTEKKPRLVYWEEACDAWVIAPERVENIIEATSHFASEDDEPVEIRFKRVDMSDEELESCPEAG